MYPGWFSDDEPFLRLESASDADMFTDAAVRLLEQRGVDALSVGAVARWMKVTPQAVLKEYSRSRVIELLCIAFARRWEVWTAPGYLDELPARLPRTEAERHGVRVHRALVELARGEQAQGRPTAARVLAGVAREERERVGVEVQALVTGLRLLLADPDPPLTWEQAADLLRQASARLVVDNQPGGGAG